MVRLHIQALTIHPYAQVAADWFGPFLAVGGMLPIAATSHLFFNEIPPMTKYNVEISNGGYGSKWVRRVSAFPLTLAARTC